MFYTILESHRTCLSIFPPCLTIINLYQLINNMIPAVEFSAGGFFFFSVVIYSSLLSPALGARCRCLLCSGFTASSAGKCGMRPGENLNRSHKVTSMRLLSPGKLLPLVCIIYILLSPFCSDKSFI